MLKTKDLYDLSHTKAAPILENTEYPWEALDLIKEFIIGLGKTLPKDEYDEVSENVWIAKDATIYPNNYIGAPAIIGHGTEVRPGAFIRGSALVGDHCVVGNSTELKNVILFDNVQVPHYNYVGDSILGYRSHMGAGSITSNVKSDKLPVTVKCGEEKQETGRKKIGAMLGDRVEVGCNSVLNPGTVIGRDSSVYPTSCVRGTVPEKSIWKNDGTVIAKKKHHHFKGEMTMKVIIVKDYQDGARKAADIIEQIVRENPECTLGLATGSSPVGMYRELARRCAEEGLDFSKVHSVNLDEYVGLDGTHNQSYRYFMNDNLFDHINIDKKNTYVAKGTGDVAANLKEFNDILDRTEIDIQVLGVGPDGHLGFNEPGEALYDGAHEETLDDSTIEANKRFFASREDVPTRAVTMGMGNIMRAKRLLMIISGNKQEAATKLLIGDRIDTRCPCTFMRLHRDATVVIEQKLADEIGYRG